MANISQEQLPENIPQQPREGLYRISVSLASQFVKAYGEKLNLAPGMVVEADIMQEKRTLLEWILEPLYATRERVVKGN